MKIIINAQLVPASGSGGIESVLVGLISALGKLDDGDEDYVIISHHDHQDWLTPYLGRRQRIVAGSKPVTPQPRTGETGKRALGPLRPLARRLWRAFFPAPLPQQWPGVPRSDGFFESLGCDVIHFPYPDFTITKLPMVYNPHDLQHRHFPEYFSQGHYDWREEFFQAGCQTAHTVAVASQWVKQDLMTQYRLSADKIQVIPWAPPTAAYRSPAEGQSAAVLKKHGVETPFAFYPAMTWPHKNHLRLLDALALLRDRKNVIVRLVCTGHKNEFWPTIEKRIHELQLTRQVKFLGIVTPEELRALYQEAEFLVMPSLFEAASGPLFEAWEENTPAACSTVTSLPEQAGDAAVLFDPLSVEAMAEAIARLATDAALRDEMRARGRQRLNDFSWERTAKAYRATYRRAAGRSLNEEDRHLLSWDWMRNPQRTPAASLS